MSLKQRAISGMIWNAMERFGSSLFLFISNLVLARLLSPDDFGAIGMLMVFISLSQAIIDGGFGSALIQKKEPTQRDYSTIFFWNVILSVVLYIVLYHSSPAIARFYSMPSLADMLRVLGIVIVFNSLFLIQNNILKKSINFKKIAKINLASIVIGTILGISAAYYGYGVWSLVIKTISTAIIQCILFWATSRWRPQPVFCWSSFKSLFSFGGYMFLNTMVNTVYTNVLSLIIGKLYAPAFLGCFTQARKLEDIPRSTLSSVINTVSFPAFAELQDNKKRVKEASKRVIKGVAFLNFPMMMFLCVVAKPLILFLFSERWEASIPLFQILCTHGLVFFLFEINSMMIISIGDSKRFFKVRMIQSSLGLFLVSIGAFASINYIVFGYSLAAYLSYFIIANISNKLLFYGFIEQVKDVLIYFVISVISAILSYSINFLNMELSNIMQIVNQAIIFIISYLSFSVLLKVDEVNIIINKFRKAT